VQYVAKGSAGTKKEENAQNSSNKRRNRTTEESGIYPVPELCNCLGLFEEVVEFLILFSYGM
jgi:hypothetical protein